MKNAITNIIQAFGKLLKSHTVVFVVCAVVLAVAIATPIALHFFNNNNATVSSNTSSENEAGRISDETMVDIHANMEKDASSQNETSSAPVASGNTESTNVSSNASSSVGATSSKPTSSSKPVTSKPSNNNTTSSSSSSPASTERTVVERIEGYDGLGLKYLYVVYSDGTTGDRIVECEHCHQMPCPDGGGDKCSKYTAAKDPAVTCQQCGKPKGDGHNGTCYGEINWNDSTKPFIICHHYD